MDPEPSVADDLGTISPRGLFVNRRLAALSVLAVSAALASPLLPGAQAASATAHGQRRVCAAPSKGYVACNAHVVTNAKTARALATTAPTTGLTPAQLQTVYRPATPASTPTVAIVDAYRHPNAAADLNAYRSAFGLGNADFTDLSQTTASDV